MKDLVVGIDAGINHAGVCMYSPDDCLCGVMSMDPAGIGQTSTMRSINKCITVFRLIDNYVRGLINNKHKVILSTEFPTGGGQSAEAIRAMAMATGVMACLSSRAETAYAVTPRAVKQFVIHNYEAVTGLPWLGGKEVTKQNIKFFVNWCNKKSIVRIVKNKINEHEADAVVVALITSVHCYGTPRVLTVPLSPDVIIVN